MRIGLLGGSFDPIHYGHLRAAEWAREAYALSHVRIVPAGQSPFKGPSVATAEDRVAMIRLALDGNPEIVLEECELRRPTPSYTVDTLEDLSRQMPDARLVLLIGSDAALGFDRWRNTDAIRKLAEVRVVPRPGVAAFAGAEDVDSVEGVFVSSTALRRAVRAGRSIRYLTPEPVRRYIESRGLYR